MIRLNKINSTFYGKINTEVGRIIDLNSEYFSNTFFNTEIQNINIINRQIKDRIEDEKSIR